MNKAKSVIIDNILLTLSFLTLLGVFLLHQISRTIVKKIWNKNKDIKLKKIDAKYQKIYSKFDYSERTSIARIDIIYLAVKSMRSKFTRTAITVGGMTIGIGSIVFLVSIGYGLQEMVIKRAVRLEEMKQINVSPQVGGVLKIDDKVINDIKQYKSVEEVLPLISAVGKISFNNSQTDVAVYGVTTKYLSNSAVRTSTGQFFISEDIVLPEKDNVLGESTLPKVEIEEELEEVRQEVEPIKLAPFALKQAVVNRSVLNVLGIAENEAVGTEFSTTFIIVGDLLETRDDRVQSIEEKYKIVGVIPEDTTPIVYIPFIDLKGLGVNRYSQLKVIVSGTDQLESVRSQIEASGFVTKSVADTVSQINSIFATAKLVLAFFGFIALTVASLGMFNTLTVSLLERTREVGLMKAIGMKSNEIRDLFLAESIIMGFLGGILGLVVGMIMGNLVSLILSIFSIVNNGGYLDVSYLPWSYVLIIILLSFFVGILTGFYPARRATKVSVLDALRYE